MAAKFPSDGSIKLKQRKGHDMTWSCDKHAEPISFYCKDHNIPLCHKCATKDHQKPCQLQDIEDVILEMRTKLNDKQSELDEMLQRFKRLGAEIQSCSTFVSDHFKNVNAEVNIAYEGKIKRIQTKKQEEILQINKEVDEEIRILNEERKRRVESCITEAEKEEQTIKETQAKHITESKKIDTKVGKEMAGIKSNNQHRIDTITHVNMKIKRIRQNYETLVNEAHQVITSFNESVSANVHRDIKSCLARIRREVETVKFIECEKGGKQFARIDGYNGTWELSKSFPLPSTLKSPFVRGLISDDKLCVRDEENNDLYISNIRNGHTNKVIEGESDTWVTSCAPIDSDLIVCGKGGSDSSNSLDGCITIYDRQLNVVRDITIPNPYYGDTVYLDVDKDGMILAAQLDQFYIYVINPANGKIVSTITMQGKDMWDGIQSLSSGDIIVKTNYNEFTVISRSGEKKSTVKHDEWGNAWCHVDKLTDALYIAYWDEERDINAVDQVSRDGDIQAKSIVEYKVDIIGESPCIITPSGNLIVCDGRNILVYKKTFLV